MRCTLDIEEMKGEAVQRLEDSFDDVALAVYAEAQRWSLMHLRQQYVAQDKYLHAFMVDCMLRVEQFAQEMRDAGEHITLPEEPVNA